jgi:hypothetical protein
METTQNKAMGFIEGLRTAVVAGYQDGYKRGAVLQTANAKTVKGESLGVLTGICYLAPASESGVMNVCTFATKGCIEACLYDSGRSKIFPEIKRARIGKTVWLWEDRESFLNALRRDIKALIREAEREGLRPAVRFNGTSDLPWVAMMMAKEFPCVMFYDYTKLPKSWLRTRYNYQLTFSYSGENLAECMEALAHGVNVSVVFDTRRGQELPESWMGYRVIDGDEHDVRFLDPRGVIVGLRAKGEAKKVQSSFVVQSQLIQIGAAA